jgi:uncharacterized damage-inducible protein DinB
MPATDPTLATFYREWEQYHTNLRTALAPLTDDQFALRAAPSLRTIGALVEHIVEGRVIWLADFTREVTPTSTELRAWLDAPEAPRDAATLRARLDASWQLVTESLARWDDAAMLKTYPIDWRGDHYDLTRGWVVWHVLEHDLHHGGEVSLTLGMHGLPGLEW